METISVVAARKKYAALRAATALAPKAFDRLAQHLAHEEADGEEVLPKHWVTAAKMVHAGER